MRSFASSFKIPIAKDSHETLKILKTESPAFGWGRYDSSLNERVSNGTEVVTSFSFKYFERQLDRQRIREIFRFSDPVLDAASAFVDSVKRHRRVVMYPRCI